MQFQPKIISKNAIYLYLSTSMKANLKLQQNEFNNINNKNDDLSFVAFNKFDTFFSNKKIRDSNKYFLEFSNNFLV